MNKILTLADIPRVKAGTTAALSKSADEIDQERYALGRRAADLLGYRGLAEDASGMRTIGTAGGPLTAALLKLDIETLDTESVIDYQLEEVSRRTKEAILESLENWATGWFGPASWSKTALNKYDRPVPEFVLDQAVRIKEAVPEVVFYVQHLSDAKADPFLVARLADEVYYIAAWDEPRFEGRLARGR